METTSAKEVVLITGCSSGFGLLTAARLSSLGYQVVATMRNLDKKSFLLDEVKKRGGKIALYPLDVTDILSIRQVISEVKSRFGRIDVLVNNAGYAIGGFFEDLTQEEIRQQMETNFFGVQNVTREVLPLMRAANRGKIINISSVSGRTTWPALGAYNASKFALEGFSESLSHEVFPFGITVSLIEPGSYPTKIFDNNRRYAKNFDNPQSPYYSFSNKMRNMVDEGMKKNRMDPEDIACLVEEIIKSKNPRMRYIPDWTSRILLGLRTFLPFAILAWIIRRAIYSKTRN